MLTVGFENVSVLKNIVDCVQQLVSETNFDFTEDGLRIFTMDSANVCTLEIDLSPDFFKEYQVVKPTTVGIPIKTLSVVLKCANPKDYVELEVKDTSKLNIRFESDSGNKTSEFELNCLDIETPDITIPDIESDYTITIPSKEFEKLCKDLTNVGDTLDFHLNGGNTVTVESLGDIGKACVTLKRGNGINIEHIQDIEELEQSFKLSYLLMFTKATPLSNNANIFFTEDMPLQLIYNIIQSEKEEINIELGRIRYCLAPVLIE